jgi:hypothetical protein
VTGCWEIDWPLVGELKTMSQAFSLKSLLGLISGDVAGLGAADTVRAPERRSMDEEVRR